MKKVLAIILVLAMALCCFAACKKGDDKKAGASSEYTEDNTFAAAMDGMTEDTDAYYVMDSAAALDNTLFNAESLTFRLGDEVFGKVAFGEDLVSSEVYVEAGEVRVAMFNGQLAITADDFGLRINLGQVLTEELFEKFKGIATAVLGQVTSSDSKDAEDAYEEVSTDLPQIVKDNKLNRDAIRDVLKSVAPVALSRVVGDDFSMENVVSEDQFRSLVNELGEFLKKLDEILTIEGSKDGDQRTYTLKLTDNSGYKIAKEFLDFLKENQTMRSLLGEILVDDLIKAEYDDVAYAAEQTEDTAKEVLNAVLVIDGGYFKSLTVNDDFTLAIEDVNDTDVTGTEYAEIEALAQANSNYIEINTVDDVFNMITRFAF